MRARRLLTATIGLAALLSVTAGPVEAASVVAVDTSSIPTQIVLTSSNPRPTYGEAYTLSGQVQLVSASDTGAATYTPFPKQPVNLDLCVSACTGTLADATWQNIATTTTGEDAAAKFSFPLVAKGTEIYRVTFDGSKYLGIIGSSAKAIAVPTYRRLAVALKQPRPGRFVVRGRVNPLFGGQPASLLRKKCAKCQFTFAQKVVTSAKGYYTFRLSRPGVTSQYVVRARASNRLEMSYSKVVQITVR
ncbi:MAG: hypothetical protein ABIQ59_06920 [Nocardioidaceae bacterium]